MLSVKNEKSEKVPAVKSKVTNEGKGLGSMEELVGAMYASGKKRSRSPSVSSDLWMTGLFDNENGRKRKRVKLKQSKCDLNLMMHKDKPSTLVRSQSDPFV